MFRLSVLLKGRYGRNVGANPSHIEASEQAEQIMEMLAEQEFVEAIQSEPDLAVKLDALAGKEGDVWLGTYGAAVYCGRETGDYKTNWYSSILENRRSQSSLAANAPAEAGAPLRGNAQRRGLLTVYRYKNQSYYAVSDLEEWLLPATLH